MKAKKMKLISLAIKVTQSTLSGAVLLSTSTTLAAASTPTQTEINNLLQKIPGLQVIALPPSGTVSINASQSLTINSLNGVTLDDTPPTLVSSPDYSSVPSQSYVERGREPYISKINILPFRLKYFTNEWSYGGYYSWSMSDYAMQHGFSITFDQYPRTDAVSSSDFFSSNDTVNGPSDGRFDLLPSRASIEAQNPNKFPVIYHNNHFMLDIEHQGPFDVLTVAKLQQASWWSACDTPAGSCQNKYYGGIINLNLGTVDAAKDEGWQSIGIYGWQPYSTQWWLNTGSDNIDPATNEAWNLYGKTIYEGTNVSVIYPSLYVPYWDDKNVPYMLAMADLNLKLVKSESSAKPVLPYFRHSLEGGGGGWRWWTDQPLRNEDTRAMAALNFFTGDQGMVLWGWTGFGSLAGHLGQVTDTENVHTLVVRGCSDTLDKYGNYNHWNDADYSVGISFSAQNETTGQTTTLQRYAAIEVLEVTANNIARFQVIDVPNYSDGTSHGIDRHWDSTTGQYLCWRSGDPITHPVYAIDATQLVTYLRPQSEPIAGVIEGLALVKVLEYSLSHGTVKYDRPSTDTSSLLPSQKMLSSTGPIVRRVKIGRYSIFATYDPQWENYQNSPRTITLNNFDGVSGRTINLPADNQTRFFIAAETATVQSISLTTSPPSSAANNTTFSVAATATSGLPVAINTSGGCSGSGTNSATITMTSTTNACTITYDQAGDDTYGAASQLSSTVQVSIPHGLTGVYYKSNNFSGSPAITRIDSVVDFNWGAGSPIANYNDNFSARWTGKVMPPVSGAYKFCVNADDDAKLLINGTQVTEGTFYNGDQCSSAINLTQGQAVTVQINYIEYFSTAYASLRWSYPGQSEQVIPASQLYAQ